MNKFLIIYFFLITGGLMSGLLLADVDTSFAGADLSQCYGWKRTAIMNDKEIKILNTLEALCKNNDKDGINAILEIPENSIEILCEPTKPEYVEPEEPILSISFKNISNKPVRFLEQKFNPISITSYLPSHSMDSCPEDIEPEEFYNTWQNDIFLTPATNPRYIKELMPDDVFTIEQPIKVHGYGNHKVNIRMGVYFIEVLTSNNKSSSAKLISDGECKFEWLNEDNNALQPTAKSGG